MRALWGVGGGTSAYVHKHIMYFLFFGMLHVLRRHNGPRFKHTCLFTASAQVRVPPHTMPRHPHRPHKHRRTGRQQNAAWLRSISRPRILCTDFQNRAESMMMASTFAVSALLEKKPALHCPSTSAEPAAGAPFFAQQQADPPQFLQGTLDRDFSVSRNNRRHHRLPFKKRRPCPQRYP